ncbi:MAG: Bug family tripartite tricarboxylate transporter substrate binding protein [Pigmentiphaga sp.]
MNFLRRQACVLLAACVAAPVLAQPNASEFPQRETRLLVPFPPGGPTDVIARILAQGLDAKWGPPVIVENRPGAGTLIATQQIAKAPPDGHLFGMVISAYTINPAIRSNMPYDTLRDLTGITQVARANMVLVASPDTPFSTVPELIEYARANPGKLSYATPGPGTATHLAGELFKKEAGVDIMHVPYNGSGPALTDLMGGRVDIMFDIYHSVKPHVEAGKLKLLALTAADRDPAQPNVPVIAEQLPGFEVYSTIGMVAPAGTPAPVIERIQQDLADVLASEEVRERFSQLGITPVGSTPDEWNAFVRSEIERWTNVARENNIRIE